MIEADGMKRKEAYDGRDQCSPYKQLFMVELPRISRRSSGVESTDALCRVSRHNKAEHGIVLL